MNLYVVTSDGTPDLFFKAEDDAQVLNMYHEGIDEKTFQRLTQHPSFKVSKIDSLEDLMELLPDEFKISDETSF